MKNYKLYVGLNVQNGNDWTVEDGVNAVISIAKKLGIEALSISECRGVYTYNNGSTVFENTLVITLVDYQKDINTLVDTLKVVLKQECIMIQEVTDKFSFR